MLRLALLLLEDLGVRLPVDLVDFLVALVILPFRFDRRHADGGVFGNDSGGGDVGNGGSDAVAPAPFSRRDLRLIMSIEKKLSIE